MAGALAVGVPTGARGFKGAEWERQKALELKLRAVPDPIRIESYMKRMAAEPHHAGLAMHACST